MGGKNKLRRFAETKEFEHVYEPTFEHAFNGNDPLKGKWNGDFYKRDQPIVLELGCGKGEYSVGLARRFPEKNFLGTDIKGARIWVGAKQALEEELPNVGFLRTRIEFINSFFGPNEISEIWITFPDPQPKKRHAKKRLTAPAFLDRYRKIIRPGGIVHLKTDNRPLYDYSLEVVQERGYEVLQATSNLYGESIDSLDAATQDILSIKTYYEEKFSAQGFAINYLKFRMPDEALGEE